MLANFFPISRKKKSRINTSQKKNKNSIPTTTTSSLLQPIDVKEKKRAGSPTSKWVVHTWLVVNCKGGMVVGWVRRKGGGREGRFWN